MKSDSGSISKLALICLVSLAAAILSPGRSLAAERRCGWLSNPATGKWDLFDRQGAWQIMFLGGDGSRAEGMEKIPDLTAGEYVYTFATKGYGCVCMTVDTVADTISRIHAVTQLPLSTCKGDASIRYFLERD